MYGKQSFEYLDINQDTSLEIYKSETNTVTWTSVAENKIRINTNFFPNF